MFVFSREFEPRHLQFSFSRFLFFFSFFVLSFAIESRFFLRFFFSFFFFLVSLQFFVTLCCSCLGASLFFCSIRIGYRPKVNICFIREIRPLWLCAIWVMPDLAREASTPQMLFCRCGQVSSSAELMTKRMPQEQVCISYWRGLEEETKKEEWCC